MASNFLKPEVIVRTALGLLEREIVLPRLVWRDAAGDFAGAKNDTITIRLPAYTSARKRVLRGGVPIVMDELNEKAVNVDLDEDLYKAVPISDEELTLDIANFGEQVLTPVVSSVARAAEDKVEALMTGAAYETTIELDDAKPYDTLIDVRQKLNEARVPMAGRGLAVGSQIEAKILKSDQLARVDQAGSDDALREAVIGRIAGFTAVSAPALAPGEGYAFHRTAYALSLRSPVVPEGATFGASESFNGLSMRVLRDYDFMFVRDRLLADVFAGANIVADDGRFDSQGRFVPSDGSRDVGESVNVTGEAIDDIIDAVGHGFVEGDKIRFSGLTGGAGLSNGTDYYVIAANLAANTFQVSATEGGAAVNFTTDITAGTAAKQGRFVRAVKIVDLV